MSGNRLRAASRSGLFGAILVAGLLAGGTAAYAATTYIVDNTNSACNDTGPNAGTSGQPFCTIAAAAKVAQAGDTVLVNAGTYAGTSVNPTNSGTAGNPITFAANPGVTINGGTRSFALSNRNYITIRGFTITGTSSYGIFVSGGSNVTITGNTESFAGTPITSPAMGIYLSNLNGGLVQGNVTHDNSAHGIYLTGTTTGVTVAGNTSYHNAYQYQRNANGIDDIAPGNSIIGNVTYANEDTGINIYTGGNNALVANNVTYDNGDHGIDDFDVTGGRIIGNTVYFNCTDGINVEGTSGNYDIENNVCGEQRDRGRHQPDSDSDRTRAPASRTIRTPATGGSETSASTIRRRPAPRPITTSYTRAARARGTRGPGPPTTACRRCSPRPGRKSAGKFANPLFVNAAAWNLQLERRIPGHRLGECRSPRASSRPTSGAIRAPTTRTPRTPATRRGRTPTVARTSSSPVVEAEARRPRRRRP